MTRTLKTLALVVCLVLFSSAAMAGWGHSVVVVGSAPVVAYSTPVVGYPYYAGYTPYVSYAPVVAAPVVVPAPVLVAPVGRYGHHGQYYPYGMPVRNVVRAALPPY